MQITDVVATTVNAKATANKVQSNVNPYGNCLGHDRRFSNYKRYACITMRHRRVTRRNTDGGHIKQGGQVLINIFKANPHRCPQKKSSHLPCISVKIIFIHKGVVNVEIKTELITGQVRKVFPTFLGNCP